jgi:hypothetical protein
MVVFSGVPSLASVCVLHEVNDVSFLFRLS